MDSTLNKKQSRALGLCSGGLDSILSAMILRRQGIAVAWVAFETPFFSSEKSRNAAKAYGVPLTVRNITEIYLEMLRKPPCGYGQNMNPCMDCHALMFRLAGDMMVQEGFDFLFSGEVLGQRPMSQTRPSLRYVEKHSGYAGRILRPLSAKLLEETIAEQTGLVDRDQLLAISGRSRKPQIQLAREFGVVDYPAPAGGCLLTDPCYSKRLRDLFDHQAECSESELHLLKYGRHYRLQNQGKVIVGRSQSDNEAIVKYRNSDNDTLIRLQSQPGPVVLVPGPARPETLMLAASLCIGYSKLSDNTPAQVLLEHSGQLRSEKVLGIAPLLLKKSIL